MSFFWNCLLVASLSLSLSLFVSLFLCRVSVKYTDHLEFKTIYVDWKKNDYSVWNQYRLADLVTYTKFAYCFETRFCMSSSLFKSIDNFKWLQVRFFTWQRAGDINYDDYNLIKKKIFLK